MFDNLSEELKTWSSDNALPNQTSYKFIAMQRSGFDPYLGGGNITIEGHKSDDNHEWQKATTYYSGTKFIKFRDKLVGKWSDWEKVVFNSDLPVFETFIINPEGSNDITLTLKYNASSDAMFAINGDINSFNGSILGVQIVHGTNQLRVLLSKAHTGNMRINVMYMRV